MGSSRVQGNPAYALSGPYVVVSQLPQIASPCVIEKRERSLETAAEWGERDSKVRWVLKTGKLLKNQNAQNSGNGQCAVFKYARSTRHSERFSNSGLLPLVDRFYNRILFVGVHLNNPATNFYSNRWNRVHWNIETGYFIELPALDPIAINWMTDIGPCHDVPCQRPLLVFVLPTINSTISEEPTSIQFQLQGMVLVSHVFPYA